LEINRFILIMSLTFPVVTNFIVTALLFVFPIFQRTFQLVNPAIRQFDNEICKCYGVEPFLRPYSATSFVLLF